MNGVSSPTNPGRLNSTRDIRPRMQREPISVFGRLAGAVRYSLAGLKAALRHEAAFRQEVALAVVAVPLAIWLGDGGAERALLVGSWWLVLIVEVLNSAIEAVVDRVGTERHELAGRAKDLGSAAVFLSILLALTTWGLILFAKGR